MAQEEKHMPIAHPDHHKKIILRVCWDCENLMCKEYLPMNKTVDLHLYLPYLHRGSQAS